MTKPSASIPKSEPSTTWEDEEWVHFEDAAEAYANFVEVSTGLAQRLLREQCASGNIRSIRYTWEPGDERVDAVLLKPSEWTANPFMDFQAEYVPYVDRDLEHPDLEEGDPTFPWTYIDVSEDDVVYWIFQARPKLVLPPTVRQGKIPRIKAMLVKLYPDGVPDPALCIRKELQGRLLKDDPTLRSLDAKTLKIAIDEYNADNAKERADGKRREG